MGAFYVQDRWMLANRLTINAGVRYDHIYIYFPEQHAAAGAWMPERTVPARDVQTWNNVVPRLGVAYDLTGQAKTVLKGSFSKYMGNEGVGLAETLNPIFLQTNRCVWRDTNGDLDAQAAEISACAGWSGGTTTTVDPNLRRPFNYEYSLGVDHQLAANLRVSVVYNRRENLDNRATINRAVPTESYIPIVINNPLNNSPLTIYNQNPATVGRQDNLLTNSSLLDTWYNGVDISFQRRFGPGSVVQGGYSYGKARGRTTTLDPSDPNNGIFTDGAIGSDQPHQFKISGSHLLPGEVTVSGAFSTNTGLPRQTVLAVGRALVPTLTRATQNVNLEPNDVNRYEKWMQLDLRIGRPFRIGSLKLEPFIDGYNLLNASTILTDVTTFGPSLGNISTTINPRMFRVGGKLNF
jgi:outer membrane receptor protein involved in Fe transport